MSIRGRSCKELFKNAGLALLDQLVYNTNFKDENKVDISIYGNDLSDLMVKWLSEILYFFEGERLITTKILVNSICQNTINSTLSVMKFDNRYHEVLREIKGSYISSDRSKRKKWFMDCKSNL